MEPNSRVMDMILYNLYLWYYIIFWKDDLMKDLWYLRPIMIIGSGMTYNWFNTPITCSDDTGLQS